VYGLSTSTALAGAGTCSLGLGLSLLSLSLIDLVRLNKVKGFGLDRFEGLVELAEFSQSADEASDTSDLDGRGVFGFGGAVS
jgi:hypothetical protein